MATLARQVTAVVTGAGSAPGVAVIKALQKSDAIDVRVVGVDANPLSAGLAFADASHVVPPVNEADFISSVLEICRRERAELVFPIIDDEQLVFATHQDMFTANGIRVIVNHPDAIRRTRDKYMTMQYARERGLRVPGTFLPVGGARNDPRPGFPLVVKPRDGRATMMVFVARNARELEFFTGYVANPMVQRFIKGQEYTIDVLMNFSGKVISVVPKARIETKAGMQVKGRTVNDPRLIEYGRAVATAFEMAPRCNVQCIMEGEVPYLIEINPKFSSSLPFTVEAGVNFPALLVQMHLGFPVAPILGEFADGLLMLRYWQEIYLRQPEFTLAR